MEEISDSISQAVHAHGQDCDTVLMVVQPGEKNAYDQQVRLFS